MVLDMSELETLMQGNYYVVETILSYANPLSYLMLRLCSKTIKEGLRLFDIQRRRLHKRWMFADTLEYHIVRFMNEIFAIGMDQSEKLLRVLFGNGYHIFGYVLRLAMLGDSFLPSRSFMQVVKHNTEKYCNATCDEHILRPYGFHFINWEVHLATANPHWYDELEPPRTNCYVELPFDSSYVHSNYIGGNDHNLVLYTVAATNAFDPHSSKQNEFFRTTCSLGWGYFKDIKQCH